jgi:hypothetical protein
LCGSRVFLQLQDKDREIKLRDVDRAKDGR